MALSRLGLGLIIAFHAVISSVCKYVMPFHRRKGRLGIEAPTLVADLVSYLSLRLSRNQTSKIRNRETQIRNLSSVDRKKLCKLSSNYLQYIVSESMVLSRLGLRLIITFHAVISSECKYVMPFHRRKGKLGIKAPT